MKKLATLFLAAGLVLSTMQGISRATDFKVSGEWDFNWEGNNTSFTKHDSSDRFKARQRLRTQIDMVASESLKGVLFLEIGSLDWGMNDGAAIGTDGINVKTRYMYVDWAIPQTDIQVRMGLQPFSLPNFVAGDAILGSDDADGAGITVSYQFNDTVAATLFWLRAEHDNFTLDSTGTNMDFVGLTLPMSGDGWQLAPWGMYGNLGKNSLRDDNDEPINEHLAAGLLPINAAVANIAKDSNNPAWWLGIGGEITPIDPLRLALDFAYGRADWGTAADGSMDLTREGWLVSALAEYRLPMLTPGLILWYGSGDDSNALNGSERMPTVAPGWGATSFGWNGGFGIADDAAISNTPTGTWGIVARLADISLMEDLTHTLAVGFYTGTNDTQMARVVADPRTDRGLYLTTDDHALEVNFDSQYKVYENLTLAVELGYIHLDLDSSVWSGVSNLEKNAYKAGLNLNYAF